MALFYPTLQNCGAPPRRPVPARGLVPEAHGTRAKRCALAAVAVLASLVVGSAGCDNELSGCETDLDCKADRVCDASSLRCVDAGTTLGAGGGNTPTTSDGAGGGNAGAGGSTSAGGQGAGGFVPPDPPVDLGAGWFSIALGDAAGISSFASRDGASFEVFGGGGDVWATADHGELVYQPVTGDFDLVAEVVMFASNGPIADTAKAALMFKEQRNGEMAPSSKGAGVFQSLNYNFSDFWYDRATLGGNISFDPVTPELNGSVSTWLRMTRVGDVFSTYSREDDDDDWVKHNSDRTVPLATSGFVGIAATSTNAQLLHVSFANVDL